jgi:predicted LPLAT superfamily acyltransferase
MKWTGKSQAKSSGYGIFIFLIKYLGLNTAYALLRLVTLYYLFFSRDSNKALIEFFKKAGLRNPGSIRHRYKAFNFFGEALIDKIAVYSGHGSAIKFDFENEKALHTLAEKNQGAILMGAHLGNWEIASQLMHRINAKVYVLMLENEHQQIKSLIESVTKDKSFEVIPLREEISMVIKIKQALEQGSFICMHADRFLDQTKSEVKTFLDSPARFPIGPFMLASKLKYPVCFVYAVKTSRKHYQFSCTEPILSDDPGYLLNEYIHLLEKQAIAHPYQWYNFYPYWD